MIAPIKPYKNKQSRTHQRPTVITGIEGMLTDFETRPDLEIPLRVMLSVARKLSNLYGQIPRDVVEQLEERYQSIKTSYNQSQVCLE